MGLPMVWKSKVFRRKSGTLRANLYVFKSATKPDDPAIVLEDKGDVGAYNRANRSLHHFSEYVAATIVTLLCRDRDLCLGPDPSHDGLHQGLRQTWHRFRPCYLVDDLSRGRLPCGWSEGRPGCGLAVLKVLE